MLRPIRRTEHPNGSVSNDLVEIVAARGIDAAVGSYGECCRVTNVGLGSDAAVGGAERHLPSAGDSRDVATYGESADGVVRPSAQVHGAVRPNRHRFDPTWKRAPPGRHPAPV